MKKIFFAFFIVCLTAFSVTAQTDATFSYLKTIPGDYRYFTVDNLGDIYLVTASDQLKKIRSNGDSVGVFNDVKKFGALTSIDASNPLKILLYYEDFCSMTCTPRT